MEDARSPGRETRWLNSRERELTQQFPEVRAEDNPPQACKTSPTGKRTQTRYNYVSTRLGPARPCNTFTLYVTEKDKVAYGSVVPDYGDMGQISDLSLIS